MAFSDEEEQQVITSSLISDERTPLNIAFHNTNNNSTGDNDINSSDKVSEEYGTNNLSIGKSIVSTSSASSEEEDSQTSEEHGNTKSHHHRKASEGVGFLGSISIAMNTLTGPAMLQLPATFQRSGIIPTCATIVFVSVLCNLCALSFANTISKVPGNLGFTKEIEYSEAFRIFWGRSWYIFTQIAFSLCILCQLLASIVDVAQVVDTYVRTKEIFIFLFYFF
jgi:hypothetical protein